MKKLFSGHLWKRWCVLGIVMWFCTVSTGIAASQADQQTDQTAGQTENTLEPEALEALNTMSDFLRTLNVFRVNSNFYRDEVLY